METILGTLFGLVLLTGFTGLKIDREYERGVIFRLGRFRDVKGPGMYWILPLVDQKAQVDIRT
nr:MULTISPECIES: SPFH domain-containing protein [unclassified Coleofasciculus]